MAAEWWLAGGLIAATVIAGWLLAGLQRRIRELAAQLERSAALRAEVEHWQKANARLAEWQAVAESSIDGGTRAARALHQGIASIPFDILETIPATRDTTRVVRRIHDFTADNVYAAISAVNRLAAESGRERLRTTRPAAEPMKGQAAAKPPDGSGDAG